MFASLKRLADDLSQRRWSQPDIAVEYEVLGSRYGGWPIAVSGLGPHSTVYSFGAGTDISFDRAAIEKFGCTVHVFDPTPKSVAWISGQALPDRLVFHPVGIDQADGESVFHSPPDADHVSFAMNPTPSARDQSSITASVMRLESIVEKLAPAPPDVVKLDIEGFEYRVIADILSGPIRPPQMLVEFHHRKYGFDVGDTARSVASLKKAGYRLFYVSDTGREYGFVRP